LKVLQLCLRVPDPPGDGGAIAMKAIAESLINAGAKVKILAFNTRKHFVDPNRISNSFRKATSLETVYLDATVKVIPAFLNLFSNDSYNIERFKSRAFASRLVQLLKENDYDIVQVESIFLAVYVGLIRQHSKAKIVLREHNVEYLIWQRMAASCKNILKKKYLSLLAHRLRQFETGMINSYDAILPITAEDASMLKADGCKLPLLVTPLGLDVQKYSSFANRESDFSVFHLGSMDWMPNVEGIDWLVREVLPSLRNSGSEIMVYLAGKNMPARLKALQNKNLRVEDAISDAVKYMSGKTVMIVPLLSGSGMRVKIIEGMAMGKTIITTTIGAEGIECTHLENIIIADSPAEFTRWILHCSRDREFCQRIGKNAMQLAASKYDNRIIGSNLYQFYVNELLGSFNLAP
jgi:glycosyltransferase involved in cell wall biosynthesis